MSELQSAVVGAGVVSFLPGINAQERESVMLATLFAQRATLSAYQGGLVTDWFSYYKNQLKFLGWDGTPASETYEPDLQRPGLVEGALQRIGASAGEPYAQSTRSALAALEKNSQALTLFESYSQSSTFSYFQLIPCSQQVKGRVDLVIFHQELQRQEYRKGFLFNSGSLTLNSQAELVSFNTRLFDQEHRTKLMNNLQRAMIRDICALEL